MSENENELEMPLVNRLDGIALKCEDNGTN